MKKQTIKKSEMNENLTYILCPDSNCEIFFDEKKFCRLDCPYPEKAKQLDYCKMCNSIYENKINYSTWQRKEHKCNSSKFEATAIKFCNNKWILIHEYPKDE